MPRFHTTIISMLIFMAMLISLTWSVAWLMDHFLGPTQIASECVLVTGVIDGDTIIVNDPNPIRLRLKNIDAPEIDTEAGQHSKMWLTDFLYSKCVQYTNEYRDRYGRTVSVVTVDNINVNKLLVEKGLAKTWDYKE